jgi:hypothetical protein
MRIEDWCTITVSVIAFEVMTGALLLNESAVFGVMTGALLLHQLSLCSD